MTIFFATGADERSQARATRLQHPIVRALEEHFATPKTGDPARTSAKSPSKGSFSHECQR